MVDIQTNITIHVPKEVVAEYTSNPDNTTEWYVNIKSIEWETEKPLRVGSRIAFVAHFLGKKLKYTYEVVKMNADEFVMRTAQGPFPMETTYRWRAIDKNSCEMHLQNRGEPSGFSKILAPMMKAQMRKANEKDLHLLKQILENKKK